MPLYEYGCRECGARFERLQSFSDTDPVSCPACGTADARRLLSVIAGMTGRAAPPAPACGQGACARCS
jgi:putative FmdB family regulatory protein